MRRLHTRTRDATLPSIGQHLPHYSSWLLSFTGSGILSLFASDSESYFFLQRSDCIPNVFIIIFSIVNSYVSKYKKDARAVTRWTHEPPTCHFNLNQIEAQPSKTRTNTLVYLFAKNRKSLLMRTCTQRTQLRRWKRIDFWIRAHKKRRAIFLHKSGINVRMCVPPVFHPGVGASPPCDLVFKRCWIFTFAAHSLFSTLMFRPTLPASSATVQVIVGF